MISDSLNCDGKTIGKLEEYGWMVKVSTVKIPFPPIN